MSSTCDRQVVPETLPETALTSDTHIDNNKNYRPVGVKKHFAVQHVPETMYCERVPHVCPLEELNLWQQRSFPTLTMRMCLKTNWSLVWSWQNHSLWTTCFHSVCIHKRWWKNRLVLVALVLDRIGCITDVSVWANVSNLSIKSKIFNCFFFFFWIVQKSSFTHKKGFGTTWMYEYFLYCFYEKEQHEQRKSYRLGWHEGK